MSSNGHVQFIWSIAELLRGTYKRSEYRLVVLPLTLLRRLDQVLEPTKEKVLAEATKYKGKRITPEPVLRKAAGQRFYNTSQKTLDKVHSDPENVGTHLREYIGGFDSSVREIFEAFDFEAQIKRLEKAGRLYLVLGKFLEVDLDPSRIPNAAMGDIYEELIRLSSEISNETAGEHFTPREVVRLCVELVLAGDEELAAKPGVIRSVYDPACGTGGMLSVMDEVVRDRNPEAELVLFGQELNPESWAVCRAEMLLKGQDPSRIHFGSTLSSDGTPGNKFDLMLANPPFGVDWKQDYDSVEAESEQEGLKARFGAGLPKKGDGALLFLQTMLAKKKPADQDHGSRIAIIFNASPLFTGGPGSGESEIRRWILENDWLEAIVALPEQLFYNTGIATYVWVLTSNKEERRKEKVQLIDARNWFGPMPKSLGDKRRRLYDDDLERILDEWRKFESKTPFSKVFPTEFFGYRRVRVDRPLRLRYSINPDCLDKLRDKKAFQNLVVPKKNSKDPDADIAAGESAQKALLEGLASLEGLETKDRKEAAAVLDPLFKSAGKLTQGVKNAVWRVISVADPTAPIVEGKDGEPVPDPRLRDDEDIPLTEDTDEYMDREVHPFVDGAWVDGSEPKIGYEIPFTRVFFAPQDVPDIKKLDEDIRASEDRVDGALRAVLSD